MASSILFSKVEDAGHRSPEFIREVEELLRRYKLPVGTPGAVAGLADGFCEAGPLQDDLLSMVNVLCLHEPEVSTLEVLGLLIVAAAGREGAPGVASVPGAEEPVRRIFNVLVETRRARQEAEEAQLAQPIDESQLVEPLDFDDAPVSGEAAAGPVSPTVAVASAGPAVLQTVVTEAAEVPVRETVPVAAEARGSVLARALAIAADEVELPREPRVPPVEPPAPVVKVEPIAVPVRAEEAPEEPSRRGFPAWAAGLCGVAAGVVLCLALMWFWQRLRGAPPVAQGTPPVEVAGTNSPAETAVLPRRSRSDAAARAERDREGGYGGAATDRNEVEHVAPITRASGGAASEVAGSGSRRGATVAGRDAGSPAANEPAATGASSGTAGAPSGSSRSAAVGRVHAIDLSAPSTADPTVASRSRIKLPSVVTGTSGIMAANVVASPAPSYPVQASAARVQGEVVIAAVVGVDGDVVDARVVSGPPMLRDAALEAVQRWRYRPYEVDGKATEIETTARVEFRLKD